MTDFVLPDVSPDHVMAVARLSSDRQVTSAETAVDRNMVVKALGVSAEIARRALLAAHQLNIIEQTDETYVFVGNSNVRYAKKSELPIFFREHLLAYPPFLIFVTQLAHDFSAQDAAAYTTAVFDIERTPPAAAKTLRAWGIYASLIEQHGSALRPTFEPATVLDLGFIRRLSEAMADAARVRMFVVDELGAELVADMARRGVPDLPICLADSLARYETEPRRVGDPVASKVESYCASLFPNTVATNSLVDVATKLEQAGIILNAHRNLLVGVAGFRHPASHGPDIKTQKSWDVSPTGSLVGQLLALVALRSVFAWNVGKRQRI